LSREDAFEIATIDTGTASPQVPVTVIVPAYNEAGTILETIHSLQEQTVTPYEIIVVDDCSSDATGEIARARGVTH
jgi:glycosyltransferase involved in cell wall biosynthesis